MEIFDNSVCVLYVIRSAEDAHNFVRAFNTRSDVILNRVRTIHHLFTKAKEHDGAKLIKPAKEHAK
jgi:hypothetical protein